jgi:hypothetical protein
VIKINVISSSSCSPRRLDVFPFVMSYLAWVFFYAKNHYETALMQAQQVPQSPAYAPAQEGGVVVEVEDEDVEQAVKDVVAAPSFNNTHGSHLLILLVILVLCHVRKTLKFSYFIRVLVLQTNPTYYLFKFLTPSFFSFSLFRFSCIFLLFGALIFAAQSAINKSKAL